METKLKRWELINWCCDCLFFGLPIVLFHIWLLNFSIVFFESKFFPDMYRLDHLVIYPLDYLNILVHPNYYIPLFGFLGSFCGVVLWAASHGSSPCPPNIMEKLCRALLRFSTRGLNDTFLWVVTQLDMLLTCNTKGVWVLNVLHLPLNLVWRFMEFGWI